MSKHLVPVTTHIPEADRIALEREAKWRHRSVSELIRRAIADYLRRPISAQLPEAI